MPKGTEIITIVCSDTGSMTVFDGKLKGSSEWFSGGGLVICKKGPVGRNYDRFCNLACNEAIARHIPARALKRVVK